MANNVFANGREISCKKADGKSICAFPDVCFTPPENPATPPGVPIPYPNTGMAKDTTSGSKKVKISGKEVMLKNKSYFKKSMGGSAGCAAKKGVITSTNRGKVYFTMWSMDVKLEGENAVRHFDMTTHNHMSIPGNSPPWLFMDTMATGGPDPCKDQRDEVEKACKKAYDDSKHADGALNHAAWKRNKCESPCKEKMDCTLAPFNTGCCDGKTPHHLLEAHAVYKKGGRASKTLEPSIAAQGVSYNDTEAPCICVTGPRHSMEHGQFHRFQGQMEAAFDQKKGTWNYQEARDAGLDAHKAVKPECNDTPEKQACNKHQMDKYHVEECKMKPDTPLRIDPQAGTPSAGTLDPGQTAQLQAAQSRITGGVGGVG